MESDSFTPISLDRLLKLTLKQLENKSYFGISSELFYKAQNDVLITERVGRKMGTPLGVAAGPHTQLTQNIVGAWLCGARFIELKTVQTLDELTISKPCIDIQEEGYNCEWSQELKIKESFQQYLNAWIIIHILNHKLFGKLENDTLFNMSVGYNMEGILNENIQWFLQKMHHCPDELEEALKSIQAIYPDVNKLRISPSLSDHVTLSTMHGCPPDEIEKIGLYFIRERKFHTTIKLNPTLLGKEKVREIVNETLGFKTPVPDIAFEHDLKYAQAVLLIKSLQNAANESNVHFGLKLTNTLESLNFKSVFPKNESQMYMSGKALHPIAVNLALKIQKEFKGLLDISFSAGADCFNFPELIACKLSPVTVCTDILKPGGYGKLNQYINSLDNWINNHNNNSLQDYFNNISSENILENITYYAAQTLKNPVYKKQFRTPSIKSKRKLSFFDCIQAPCISTCPTHQNIPEYLQYASEGNFQKAFEIILKTNPFPTVTGTVCDHDCQNKCTRINYDETLAIREVKRYIAEKGNEEIFLRSLPKNGQKASIIGAGPSGLSCAFYLLLAGFDVTVYEEKMMAGGMVSDVIPAFRLSDLSLQKDINRIISLGVNIQLGVKINQKLFNSLHAENQIIYIATGAPKTKKAGLLHEEAKGVIDPLLFLSDYKKGGNYLHNENVIVMGGGNTAMDVARTAKRALNSEGNVSIVYRRRTEDMPADAEEIQAVIAEGIQIIEMCNPVEVIQQDGKMIGLLCVKMIADGFDTEGRMKTVPDLQSEFELKADILFPAIGQDKKFDFVDTKLLYCKPDEFETQIPNVFIGGDAKRGASNIISAIADGRKVAELIIEKTNSNKLFSNDLNIESNIREILIQKSQKSYSLLSKNIIHQPQITTDEEAMKEAGRCLKCHQICNVCVSVCPNFANFSYEITPETFQLQKVTRNEDKLEISNHKEFIINQKYQILNLADFCNECGNCNTFCPTESAPYKEKPRFYFSVKSFNQAEEGYFMSKFDGKINLIQREGKRISTLFFTKDGYTYETEEVIATFTLGEFRLKEVSFKVPCIQTAYFENAITMKVLLHAVEDLY